MDSSASSVIPTESPTPTPSKGRKRKAQDVVFARPVFANEFFNDEKLKERFDALPPWQRHLVKRIVDHGDLARAAEEAGVSTHVNKYVDGKLAEQATIKDALTQGGITPDYLVERLKACLDNHTIKFDKHQNPIRTQDMDLVLRTLDTIFKLRGDFVQKAPPKEKDTGVELFADTKIDD
jgi:hypothetical protein